MSISEAAQLVIQSSSLGVSGNIFLLKMGKPIKIIDIAKKLINDFNKSRSYITNKKKLILFLRDYIKMKKCTKIYFMIPNKINTSHPKIYIDSSELNIDNDFYKNFLNMFHNFIKIEKKEIFKFISKYIKTFKY